MQVWLQYKIVLQVRRLVYGFLCCNTVVCIAELKAGLYCNRLEGCWRAVLQYSVLYCNRLQEAKLSRNTKLYCDGGLGVLARRQALGARLGAQAERWALGTGRARRRQGAGHVGGRAGAERSGGRRRAGHWGAGAAGRRARGR